MSQGMSPYQSPQAEMPSDLPSQSAVKSGTPKVFGILHLVFGGIGIVWGLISLVSLMFKDQLEQFQFSTYPEEVRESMKEAMAPINEIQVWDIVSAVGSMVLAVLLIVAGYRLVKYRKSGLKTSNIYSALAIVHKLYALVVVLAVKAPTMKAVGDNLDELGGDAAGSMGQMMGPIVVISGVVMAVLMMVYPVLCYVLLNKKQSRESLS